MIDPFKGQYQKRVCILTVDPLEKRTYITLMDGDKPVFQTEIYYHEANPTFEPSHESVENMGIRANQEQGLNAEGEKIDVTRND